MSKSAHFFKHVFGLIACLLVPTDAYSLEWSFDTTGRVSAYYSIISQGHTDLVPDPTRSGYHGYAYAADAMLQSKLAYGPVSLSTQLRFSGANDHTNLSVDEAFVEYQVNDLLYVYAGRRLRSFGQAYGLNPVDVYHDPLIENRLYPAAQTRNDVQGQDMIGLDLLFANGGSLGFAFAPNMDPRNQGAGENFWLLQYSGFGVGGAVDYTLSAYGGLRPGIGFSASYGIGDANVFYVDATLRRGRQKQTLLSIAPDAALHFDGLDEKSVKPYITVGWGHTFGNGAGLNLEYTLDTAGYSNQEWAAISQAIDMVSPVATPQMGHTLGQLNRLLNHYTLRQNYGFMRLSHDNVFGTQIKSALTVLHGFDDGSGSVGLRIEYPVTEAIEIGLYASQKYGVHNSEFMLRPNTSSLSIYATVRF